MMRTWLPRVWLAALALIASGCGAQSTFRPAGPAAESIADLGWFVLITFSIATIVTWVLLLWPVFRRRGTLEEHEPASAEGGINWILIGGFAVPAAVLAIVFIVTLRSMSAFPMHHAQSDPQIRVVGHQWWFEVQYRMGGPSQWVTTATEIHVPVGQPVDIALASADVIHSFWIPQLQGKVDLIPGMVNHVRIRADRPGRYSGQCAEYCGAQHANMRLYVIAEPVEEFNRWLRAQRQPAAAPQSAGAQRGKEHFEAMSCAYCHTVRGTAALGSVGPDLTHVGSRETIAGGMLPNNIANMHAWVTRAQAIKPGSAMPDLTQFSGDELHDIVDYLRSLR